MKYKFKFSDFLNGFSDVDNDKPCKLYIKTLPGKGFLSYKGRTLTSEDIPLQIESCDVDLLEYQVNENNYGLDTFNFHIIDSNPNNPKISNMAVFRINTAARPNQPPSVVGDQNISIAYNTVETLTVAMFTTGTTPAYADPESDAAFKVKILSLPTIGQLRLSGVAVTVNQEILISQISQGLLTYHSDSTQTAGYTTLFNFAVSDTGSQQFTT